MKKSILLFFAILFISTLHGQDNSTGVKIGSQTWMVKNLDVDHYRNGDPIPHVKDDLAWRKLRTGAYCYYNNDSAAYAAIYGKLYNFYAVNDPRGLAPNDWHVPSDAEWTILVNQLGGDKVAGGKMKETGTLHWQEPNNSATNSSGFAALPGGFNSTRHDYPSLNIGFNGVWWSTTERLPSIAWYRALHYNAGEITSTFDSKRMGLSVRCLRN